MYCIEIFFNLTMDDRFTAVFDRVCVCVTWIRWASRSSAWQQVLSLLNHEKKKKCFERTKTHSRTERPTCANKEWQHSTIATQTQWHIASSQCIGVRHMIATWCYERSTNVTLVGKSQAHEVISSPTMSPMIHGQCFSFWRLRFFLCFCFSCFSFRSQPDVTSKKLREWNKNKTNATINSVAKKSHQSVRKHVITIYRQWSAWWFQPWNDFLHSFRLHFISAEIKSNLNSIAFYCNHLTKWIGFWFFHFKWNANTV